MEVGYSKKKKKKEKKVRGGYQKEIEVNSQEWELSIHWSLWTVNTEGEKKPVKIHLEMARRAVWNNALRIAGRYS